jgi:hypothetical protein
MLSVLILVIVVIFFASISSLRVRKSRMTMNIFDDMKNIFSGNNKDVQNNVKSIKEKEKYDMMKIQQEILERRRDPRKMREYEEETDKRRKV